MPRLWRLRHRRRSRVFTGLTLPQVLDAVLDGHDLPRRWTALAGRFPSLPHVVQRDETDLAFFERIAARAGIFYHFEPTPDVPVEKGGERIVLGDAPIYDAARGAEKMMYGGEADGVEARADELLGVALAETLAVEGLRLGAFDWTHPNTGLRAAAGPRDAAAVVDEHLGEGVEPKVTDGGAAARLAQHRRRAVELTARSRSTRLVPGCRFGLAGHSDVDDAFVVTALEHTLRMHDGGAELRYESRVPGWGVQFTPRVGHEVLVVYSGGDPDRPIIAGSLANGTHPPPFAGRSTVSGIRTSTVGGGPAAAAGHNELSFEDASGREEVRLRAQRDLHTFAGRVALHEVQGDEYVSIGRAQEIDVAGPRSVSVGGLASATLWNGASVDVKGDVRVAATGRVSLGAGEFALEMDKSLVAVKGDAQTPCDGNVTARVRGCATMLVGSRAAPAGLAVHVEGGGALSASDVVEIRADKGLVLRCGTTMVRLDAQGVEIVGAAIRLSELGGGTVQLAAGKVTGDLANTDVQVHAKSVVLRAENARLALDTEAHLDGEMILIASPGAGQAEPWEPPPATTIALADAQGRPLAGERFVLHVGEEVRAGVLDGDGHAVVTIDPGAAATIAFPDVRDVGPSSGAAPAPAQNGAVGTRTHGVRAGEHLAAIAHELGLDPAALWGHPGNEKLRALRGDGTVLAEGDVLCYAPPAPPPALPVEVGRANTFQGRRPTLETHLRLVDGQHAPIAAEPYVARVAGEPDQAGTTDADGRLTVQHHVVARAVCVELTRRGQTLQLALGDVDPVASVSGQAQRLAALGFSNLASYQGARGLPANGVADAATLAELQKDFGC